MAGSLSNWAEEKLIAHSVGKESWSSPSLVFLALYTTAPTDDTEGTEVSSLGTAYTRKKLSNTSWAGSLGTLYNVPEITFGPAAADWGSVQGIAVLDASTVVDVSGNHTGFNTSTKVLTVTSPTLTAGALVGKHLMIGTTTWGVISANTTNTITVYSYDGTTAASSGTFTVSTPKVVWYGTFSTARAVAKDESMVFSPSSIILTLS